MKGMNTKKVEKYNRIARQHPGTLEMKNLRKHRSVKLRDFL